MTSTIANKYVTVGNLEHYTETFTTNVLNAALNTYAAAFGASLSINGTSLSLVNSSGTTLNSVTIPTTTSLAWSAITSKPETFTPATHSHVGTEVSLTGYSKASSVSAVAATDTVNAAIGKLEKAIDGKQASGSYLTSSSTLDASKLSGTVPSGCYTNTTYSNFVGSGSSAAAGLVPAPPSTAGTTKFLREDGQWAVASADITEFTTSEIDALFS